MRIRLYPIACAALLSVVAFAPSAIAEPPAWTFVEAGYNQLDIDAGSDQDGSGWYLGGSFGTDHAHIFGSYAKNETDELGIDVDRWDIGGGWHGLLGERADLFADLAYANAKRDYRSEAGYYVRFGARWRLIRLLELGVNARYEDLGDWDSDVLWNANAMFYVWRLGIGVSADLGDEVDTYNAFVRFNFN